MDTIEGLLCSSRTVPGAQKVSSSSLTILMSLILLRKGKGQATTTVSKMQGDMDVQVFIEDAVDGELQVLDFRIARKYRPIY